MAAISRHAYMLGTMVALAIYDRDREEILDECLAQIAAYENRLSKFLPDSEVSQMNHRTSDRRIFSLSEDLCTLIEQSLFFSQLSDGAFDITTETLSDLWNVNGAAPSVPQEGQIRCAMSAVGYQKLRFRKEQKQLEFLSDETKIDLGGIAKGYIADRIKELLLSRNVQSAIINLGGNVLCVGSKPDGTPFRVGVRKPFGNLTESQITLRVHDLSVVSSGVYERCFCENGVRYHHLMDPFTGAPFKTDIASVTIISESSTVGDGLSTVCFALGLDAGVRILESQKDVYGIFIMNDGKMHLTSGTEKFVEGRQI